MTTATESKQSVLGILVHRAVFMPFAKAQRLKLVDGKRVLSSSDETIEEVVDQSARLVVKALMEEKVIPAEEQEELDNLLNLLVDAGGPWWSKTATDYRNLSSEDQHWVRGLVRGMATDVAQWLQSEADRHRWSWMQTEVELWGWGSDRPKCTRIDILAMNGGRTPEFVALDLKTSSSDFGDKKPEVRRGYLESLQSYRTALESTNFPHAENARIGLLFASSEFEGTCQAFREDGEAW